MPSNSILHMLILYRNVLSHVLKKPARFSMNRTRVFQLSETDRPIYPGEKEGVHFNFVSRDKMDDMIHRDDLLDHRQHNNYRYGTTFSSIRKVMAHNKLCIVNCCNPEVITIHWPNQKWCPFFQKDPFKT